MNGICVNDDDVPVLLIHMLEADGILFSSPVCIDDISGQMKVLVDLLADGIHYEILAGKFGPSLATICESGGDEVMAFMNHVLNYLGIISEGGISVASLGDVETVFAAEAVTKEPGKNLECAVMNGFSDHALETVISENRSYFRKIVEENRDFRPGEYERWVLRGWIR
jgi:multimeric flavodoxin WrbA